jgi:hypothetical protein
MPQQRTRDTREEEAAQAHQRGWVAIRNNAVIRMRRMALNHVRLAVSPQRGRIPGPHALAFLYAWHTPASTAQAPVFDVAAATRLFDDTADTQPGHNVRDLPALLYGLYDVALDRIAEGAFDPRTTMADRGDEMDRDAAFVGLAVSSLGEPAFPYDLSLARAKDALLPELNMPMMWRIRLTDGTRIEVEKSRGGTGEVVRSSERLDLRGSNGWAGSGQLSPWQWLEPSYAPPPGTVDHELDRLCLTVAAGIRDRGPRTRR